MEVQHIEQARGKKQRTAPDRKKMPGTPLESTKEQLKEAKEQVQELAKVREVRNALYGFADKADENTVLVNFRKVWDEMPHAVQWAMIYVPGSVVNVHSDLLKLLIQTGLIEYKGAKTDKDIKAMSEWENLKLEWTVRLGKFVIPELKAVEALLPVAMEIKGIKEEIFTDVRYHLRETRQKKEDSKKYEQIKASIPPGGQYRKAA